MDVETGQEEYEEKAMGNCTIMWGCDANVHHEGCPEDRCEGRGSGADCERGSFGMPGVGVGRVMDVPTLDYIIRLTDSPSTNQAARIMQHVVPSVLEHFISRNREYGESAHVLGVKGQYADINRKVIKLKRYLWDDVPVPDGGESIETIAGELIGHLLILIDELNQEKEEM